MLNRILYGSRAVGMLTAGYVLGSVSLSGAFAKTAPTPNLARPQTAPATRAQETNGQPEANEQAESAALASQAKITTAQANATALGTVIYTVHLTDSAGKKQESKVDATTGQVLPPEASRESPLAAGSPSPPLVNARITGCPCPPRPSLCHRV